MRRYIAIEILRKMELISWFEKDAMYVGFTIKFEFNQIISMIFLINNNHVVDAVIQIIASLPKTLPKYTQIDLQLIH